MTAEFIVAVHAAVYLSHSGDWRTSEQIAENVCTNPARVRKVMSKLKKADIVEAHTSRGGGYRLACPAGQLTLARLLGAVEEQVVNVEWRSGSDCADCPISRTMAPVMDGIFDRLEEDCRRSLNAVTVDSIQKNIFQNAE